MMYGKIAPEVSRRWPGVPFSWGIHPETRRYCIFIYDACERGSSIPAVGAKELAAIELGGSSEKDIEVLMTKLVMVLG